MCAGIRESVCVKVCVCIQESVTVSRRKRERVCESVCAYENVSVCVGIRESVCESVRVHACMHVCCP